MASFQFLPMVHSYAAHSPRCKPKTLPEASQGQVSSSSVYYFLVFLLLLPMYLSWECRGLDNAHTKPAVSNLIRSNGADILFLCVTKLSSLDSALVANWGFQDVFLVPSCSQSGLLGCFFGS